MLSMQKQLSAIQYSYTSQSLLVSKDLKLTVNFGLRKKP